MAVKIGISTSIQNRLKDLQCANPHKLVLIGICPFGGSTTERYYHSLFIEYRIRGEWYMYEGHLKEFVEGCPVFKRKRSVSIAMSMAQSTNQELIRSLKWHEQP